MRIDRRALVMSLIMVVGLMGVTSTFAVELTQASNQQILDEISRRLGGSPYPNPTPVASATYVCDSRSDLIVTLAGRDTSSSFAVSTTNLTNCSSQANTLSAHRSGLSNTTLIGICDTQADLHRISLNLNGVISQIGETSMSNMSQCMDAASRMNSSLTR